MEGCVITKYGWTNSIKCQNVIKYHASQLKVLCLPNERKFTLLRPSWHVKVKKERYQCYYYWYNIIYSLEPLISTPFSYGLKIPRLLLCVIYRYMINLKLMYRSMKLESFAIIEPYEDINSIRCVLVVIYLEFHRHIQNHFNQFTKDQVSISLALQ